jgi:hypothetical protein
MHRIYSLCTTAACVDLTQENDGEWRVEQTEAAAELSIPDDAVQFDWSFSPTPASHRPTASSKESVANIFCL